MLFLSKLFIHLCLIKFQIALSNNKDNAISRIQRETSPRKKYCMEYDKNTKTKTIEQKQTKESKLSVPPVLRKIVVDEERPIQSHSLTILSPQFYQSVNHLL